MGVQLTTALYRTKKSRRGRTHFRNISIFPCAGPALPQISLTFGPRFIIILEDFLYIEKRSILYIFIYYIIYIYIYYIYLYIIYIIIYIDNNMQNL